MREIKGVVKGGRKRGDWFATYFTTIAHGSRAKNYSPFREPKNVFGATYFRSLNDLAIRKVYKRIKGRLTGILFQRKI